MKMNPKEFGLTARTVLDQLDETTVAIVIDRKSRIGMADGKKILEKVQKIKKVQPAMIIALKTTAPVCSKTQQFLEGEGVRLIFLSF